MITCRALPRLQQPFRPHSTTSLRRAYVSTQLSNGIKLAYDLHEPPSSTTPPHTNVPPIIFIHGLFGSKKNNRSISKALARDLRTPVYALDLRNHGDSTQHPRHDYSALAEDVELFLTANKLENSALIGHSMGAKTAMSVALRHRVPVAALISVDNAPVDAALKSDFGAYVRAMRRIEETGVSRQSEADVILTEYEQSLPIRQFLLTNLVRDSETGKLKWRIPVKILAAALDSMADFPFKDPDETRYEGPTLMVRGTKSHYVADEMLPMVGRFFPKFRLVDVEAGHWVISENPEGFRKAVVDFLQDQE